MKMRVRNVLLLAVAFAMMLGLTPLASADPVECEILAFSFAFQGLTKHATIDHSEETGIITIIAPEGMDLKAQALVPQIELPLGASISPPASEPQDFSQIVRYTVSVWDAQAPQTREYLVRVSQGKTTAPRVITGFSLNGYEGIVNELNKTILVDVPAGTDISAMHPAVTHNGAAIAPHTAYAQDFSKPVTYTITMRDGSEEAYTVLVEYE